MKNPHYTHVFFCQNCGIQVTRNNKDKSDPKKYCSQQCSQKARIGYKMCPEKSFNNIKASFEKKVIKKEGCWGWKGYIAKTGYAILSSRFLKEQRAHRISYIIHKGKIPDGLNILHSCHNPTCTNPDHLRIGTHKENVKDKCDAFRQHFKVKEQKEKMRAIKIILKNGTFSIDEISKMFNTSENSIVAIKRKIIEEKNDDRKIPWIIWSS